MGFAVHFGILLQSDDPSPAPSCLEASQKNISSGELDENSVCAKYAQTADDGKNYNYKFYSLAAIIAVGYRTNSDKATQFRQWATKALDAFTKQGYVLDKSRLTSHCSD